MGLFKRKRAEEPTGNTVEETESMVADDQILRAWITGEKMDRDKALEIPAVTGCIDMIAKTVANIPIKLYKREGKKVTEIKGDIRTFLLNEETGDTLDSKQMKQAIVRDYYLGNGGYVYVNWNGLEIESLHYVYSQHVSITQNFDVIFKDFAILIQGKSYYPSQFIRILRNTVDGMHSKSIVQQNEKLLSASYHSLKYEENLVKTGGNKKGFVKAPKKLTQQAMDELKKAWNKLYKNNSENVVILNDGLEFQEASNTSVEMQMNENKKTNSDEFCKIFNIPPTLLNGGVTEQDDKVFIKYCINDFLGEFITAINKAMLLESEKETYFFAPDLYELTKGDEDKRYTAYKTASETGWLQLDDIREKENMEPLGLEFVKLGLQDVLYNPKTKTVYTPNTGKTSVVGEGGENGE